MNELEHAMEQIRINTLKMSEMEQVAGEYEAKARALREQRLSLKIVNEDLSRKVVIVRETSEAAKAKAKYEELHAQLEAKLKELNDGHTE